MRANKPTMDDITEKEVLLEIYTEIKAIRQLLFIPVYLFVGGVVIVAIGSFA